MVQEVYNGTSFAPEYSNHVAVFCIIGTAGIPLASKPTRLISYKEASKRRDRFEKKVWNFINKPSVLLVGGGKNHELIIGQHRRRLDLNVIEFPRSLDWKCPQCNSSPGSKCRTPKGRNVAKHKLRVDYSDEEPMLIGERVTGPGSYYFFKGNLYLGEDENSVKQFVHGVGHQVIEDNNNRQRIPDEVQIFVWNRDRGVCVKCGTNENLAFDHIIPFSLGGSDTKRNLQILCDSCNSKKGNKIGG